MHIMRDVYMTITSFTKRIQDYSNYKRATQDMNTRYPDATAEELGSDNTCIVCREVMVPWAQPTTEGAPPRPTVSESLRAKKLPCGHILHLRCLKAWLERQQACPTCRRPVIGPTASATRDAQANPRPLPGAGDQQGADGNGPAAAPGNPPRQQGLAARMRWLNMGPVRIGFYNGPPNMVQEALQRRQAAPGVAEAGVVPPSVAQATTQSQLRAVELRLIQQAYELNIEQSQLVHVRALEAELARLRLQHTSGSVARAAAQGIVNPLQQPFGPPMNRGLAQPHPIALTQPPFPQAFQPVSQQQPLGPGHAELPQGMTLPEGWSVLPLQRVGGQVAPGSTWSQAQSVGPPHGLNTAVPPPQATQTETIRTVPTVSPSSTQPSDEERPTGQTTHEQQSNGPQVSTDGLSDERPPSSASGTTAGVPAPWRSAGWNFGTPEGQTASSFPPPGLSGQSSSTQDTEKAQASPIEQGPDPSHSSDSRTEIDSTPRDGSNDERTNGETGSSKGKGRAVEVEDVQDPEI